MAHTAKTADAYHAIADRRRREIMGLLAQGRERTVGELVDRLGIAQPAVSKHLHVLRRVGLVRVTRDGRHRRYRLEAGGLKDVHDWVKTFERFWTDHLDQIKKSAEKKVRDCAAERN